MRLLLHSCCCICQSMAYHGLKNEFQDDLELTIYWYNPNIHPLIEYRRRLKSVYMLSQRLKLEITVDDDYGLKKFCKLTAETPEVPERCTKCYQLRLDQAAARAQNLGFDYFATTLTTSSHQSHQLIIAAGKDAAAATGTNFLYRDWRNEPRDPKLLNGLYKQQYCGCIYSEYDRYKDTNKHLYREQ